ncbi:uncharacterized protein LOC121998558 [Zingiber officinale]|uniref:uncharacterized protein LOC121998558 n=1 Tax=Zingiber officinale TaxID=94328 RepID=UPI001C4CD934|nr:uncharacterized protein LOC121998558 [Zingiber officinale]
MARSAEREELTEKAYPAIGCHRNSRLPPASNLHLKRGCRLRRPIRNQSFSGSRQSGPVTALVTRKLHGAVRKEKTSTRGVGWSSSGDPLAAFSARKLATALWHLPAVGFIGSERQGRVARLGLEPNATHLQCPNVCDQDGRILHNSKGNELGSLISPCSLNASTQKATKWESRCLKSLDEMCYPINHTKLHKYQLYNASVIPVLQAKLVQAHSLINELRNGREPANKKLIHFLRKLLEEKALWQRGEHEKVQNILNTMKNDLNRERKSRKRAEAVHSKLVNELAQVKLSAKQYMQDYEKERKAREFVEHACNEFAKEIGDDKAEVLTLKRKSVKVQEELDADRKMLHLAELWREERVQMKLVDANLMLKEKYADLMRLQEDLDVFIITHSTTNMRVSVLKEAVMLRESVNSVKLEDIQFYYQPPASGGIFSIFNELQPREEANQKEIDRYHEYACESHPSNIQAVSPETDIFLENPINAYANGLVDKYEDIQYDNGVVNMSHIEGCGSCNYLERNDPSVNSFDEKNHASVSITDWHVQRQNCNVDSETCEICSIAPRQSKKKAPYIGKFWRSSRNKKNVLVELPNGKVNGRNVNVTVSPGVNSDEVGSTTLNLGASVVINPHVSRGIKGCVEWRRGTKAKNLKTKLLEARMENQMAQQLCHASKNKC